MLFARASAVMYRGWRVSAMRGLKSNTGIVGLEVEPNAKEILTSLYTKTLQELNKIPPTAEYRKSVEQMTKERLDIVKGTDDLASIEAAIAGGQVEQLIQQAKDELGLIPTLLSARVFDPYDGSPVEDILTDLKRRVNPHTPHCPNTPSQIAADALASNACAPACCCAKAWMAHSSTVSVRRGVALQRDDVPMRQSKSFPTERFVELELPAIEDNAK
ncbi:hypothetical protein AB1Y20_020268 [Prymnesium parvum]|uniref:NADH dehydrogenase [ubiquinone] 1 alpha subcomplex subunit 5 n=1 Tax=Prymnesium parvum TaxID=97485 RepID=A0AB34JUL9_PRYPA